MNKNMRRIFAALICLIMVMGMTVSVAATEPTDETRGPEMATPGVYDFVLEEQYVWIDRDRFSGKGLHSVTVQRAMQEYYEAGNINWLYATDNISFMSSNNVQASAASAFGSTETYKWRGLRLGVITRYDGNREYAAGYWYAFTFRAPEAGTYNVNLEYMYRNDGATVTDVYFFDDRYVDPIAINAEMTEENLLATMNFNKKTAESSTYEPATCDLGNIHVTEEEFTLVFYAKEKISPASCCYMVLSRMELTPVEGGTSQGAPLQPTIGAEKSNPDLLLWVGIGGGAVLLIAIVVTVVLVTGKKRK